MNHEKQFEFDFSEIPALTADQITSLSIDLSSGQDNIMTDTSVWSGSIDTITISNTSPYVFANTSITSGTIGAGPWTTGNSSGKISLAGDNADIEVNGKSLMKVLESMEERLNLLTPNAKLESDWEELAKLGKKYRKLETKIKEKARAWDILKSMPPPKID
jgi:hypothetical protein